MMLLDRDARARVARSMRALHGAARGTDAGAAAAARADAARAAVQVTGGNRQPQQGWGLTYDHSVDIVSRQAVAFAAAGQVTTADGRTIDVALVAGATSTITSHEETHVRAGDATRAVDPLVINEPGRLATIADETVSFDLDADGVAEQVHVPGSGAAFLALDANGNGTIDDGSELFGPGSGSGFGELAALDSDGNGWIDEGDAAFAQLSLWRPGGADSGLQGLAAAGIGALSVASVATPFDLVASDGSVAASMARTGIYLREDGTPGTIQHVDLVA